MSRSDDLFKRAQAVIPGGVNSPVRAYGAVGGTPRFIERAMGSRLIDVDGNELIDYVCSYGAIILGHADARVAKAVARALEGGSTYGAPTEAEVLLAERIASLMPGIETLRLVSSGTEAAMSAVRVARGATGRARIIKFAGCYHGHSDALLARAGSGAATVPDLAGVPAGATADTTAVAYNDIAAFDRAVGDDVACVIVEPVAANMGVVPPAPGFLAALRAGCDRHGAMLIFDEVITGFRLGLGGAQERFGISPDLTCLGKIIGGGLPIGAFGGRADVMASVAPEGPVYQAGTLSGNPLAVAAGLAVLDSLVEHPPYEMLERNARALCEALASRTDSPVTVNREGSLFSAFFAAGPVDDYDAARAQDAQAFARFFHALMAGGVALAPSPYESWFLTASHSEDDIARTIDIIENAGR